jgi:hypothetical protein
MQALESTGVHCGAWESTENGSQLGSHSHNLDQTLTLEDPRYRILNCRSCNEDPPDS